MSSALVEEEINERLAMLNSTKEKIHRIRGRIPLLLLWLIGIPIPILIIIFLFRGCSG